MGEPEMPKHLDRDGRREWKRLVPLLTTMKVLTESDGLALANLCMTYSTLVQAQRLMLKSATGKRSSLLIRTRSGYIQQSPLLGIINSQMAALTVMLREFGLTPASRSRIVATSESSGVVDELERKLCGEDEDFLPGGSVWAQQQRKN
jgi:P27 family predicted phage terminase small subunit